MDTIEKMNITQIRNKIDKIDCQIHDLLMQRAETIQEIIAVKQSEKQHTSDKKQTIYRPAREAQIIKNMLLRHSGSLPHTTVIAMWRFLIASFCALQTDFSIAYYGVSEAEALRDAIRYYFGSTVKLKKAGTELSVLHAVSSEEVTLGILPISNVDVVDEWWLKLPKNIYVSGVLPFVKDDNTVHVRHDYMIVSHSEPTPTENDKSLFRITGNPDVGRISVINCFSDLKQQARSMCIFDSKDLSQRFHLIEVDGFFDKETAVEFIITLKKTFKEKIFDADYLGSYPAPISLLDYQKT
jgi:chorismate mutase / prephenate dehydratase